MACGILVHQPGIEPISLALEAQSFNHWTAKQVQYAIYWYLANIYWTAQRYRYEFMKKKDFKTWNKYP